MENEVSKPQADEAGASAAPEPCARGVPPLDSALRRGGCDLLTPFRMRHGERSIEVAGKAKTKKPPEETACFLAHGGFLDFPDALHPVGGVAALPAAAKISGKSGCSSFAGALLAAKIIFSEVGSRGDAPGAGPGVAEPPNVPFATHAHKMIRTSPGKTVKRGAGESFPWSPEAVTFRYPITISAGV